MQDITTYTKPTEVNNLFNHLERLSTRHQAEQFMYMSSERKGEIGNRFIIDHKFKNINTRKYITMVESVSSFNYISRYYENGQTEYTVLCGAEHNSKYAIKGIK